MKTGLVGLVIYVQVPVYLLSHLEIYIMDELIKANSYNKLANIDLTGINFNTNLELKRNKILCLSCDGGGIIHRLEIDLRYKLDRGKTYINRKVCNGCFGVGIPAVPLSELNNE